MAYRTIVTATHPATGREYKRAMLAPCDRNLYGRVPKFLYFDPATPDELIDVLTAALETDRRLRLFYGDETGKDYGQESEILGTIGMSTGPIKVPLLIANSRALGGPALLTTSIVKVVDVASKQVVYVHPNYTAPVLDIFSQDDGSAVVNMDGELWAQFPTWKAADRRVKLLLGKRMAY